MTGHFGYRLPLCKDCKHYEEVRWQDSNALSGRSGTLYFCRQPLVTLDPVSGETRPVTPYGERSSNANLCGIDGRLFEAKEA